MEMFQVLKPFFMLPGWRQKSIFISKYFYEKKNYFGLDGTLFGNGT